VQAAFPLKHPSLNPSPETCRRLQQQVPGQASERPGAAADLHDYLWRPSLRGGGVAPLGPARRLAQRPARRPARPAIHATQRKSVMT